MEQHEIITPNTLEPKENKRPTAITVICILGLIGAVIVIPLIFSNNASQIGRWYPPFLALSAANGLICMIGLWKMKKWAVYLYTGFFVIAQIVLLMTGTWSIGSLVLPAIFIVILFSYLNKMS